MEILSKSERETEIAGKRLAEYLRPGMVVALFGNLGMGKTAFVRGIAEGLGITNRVNSPTFTIVNEYDGAVPLFHFDMYRLSSANELFEIGWDDYLERGGVCVVEWSEKVTGAFPEDTIKVLISRAGDNQRNITIIFPEEESA